MRVLVVTSQKDPAGLTIHQRLLQLYDFCQVSDNPEGHPVFELGDLLLTSTDRHTISASHVENWFEVDLIIFATKHTSVSGRPCLTIHTPGNLTNEVLMGGKSRRVSVSPAVAIKLSLRGLFEAAEEMGLLDRYEVCLECTHHGDYLERAPCFFIEIGSQDEEWRDIQAAEAIAKSIYLTSQELASIEERGERVAIGVGGPHYNARLTTVMLRTDIAVGHIIPKYVLSEIDEDTMRQAVDRTHPRPGFALLDWKGLGREKRRILSMLGKLGITWKKIRDVMREKKVSN